MQHNLIDNLINLVFDQASGSAVSRDCFKAHLHQSSFVRDLVARRRSNFGYRCRTRLTASLFLPPFLPPRTPSISHLALLQVTLVFRLGAAAKNREAF